MDRLNIIITQPDAVVARRGHLVYVRDGYSPVETDWGYGPTCREFRTGDASAIRAYVSALRAERGMIPVQDNSGLLLDQ